MIFCSLWLALVSSLPAAADPAAASPFAEPEAPPPDPISAATQVSLHPLSLLANHLNVELEHRLRPGWSLLVAPKVGLGPITPNRDLRLLSRSVGAELGGRWYPGQTALRGFFVQPTAAYTAYLLPDGLGTAHLMGLRGKAGYQWFFAERMALHLAGGLMVNGFVVNAAQEAWIRRTGQSRYWLNVVNLDLSFGIGIAL